MLKTFIVAVAAMFSVSTVYAMDPAINGYEQSAQSSVSPDDWYNPDIDARDQLLTVQTKILENAKVISDKGPRWALETAKIKRLEILLAKAKENSENLEAEIAAIVADQNELSAQAAQLVTQLSIQLEEENFAAFRNDKIVPTVKNMESLRDQSVGFVQQMEQQNAAFQTNAELQNSASHAALTKFELNEFNKLQQTIKSQQ